MDPLTTPAFGVTVERDVPYATAEGYWTHAPVGDIRAVVKLFFRNCRLKPVTLEMDIYRPEGDKAEKRPLLLMMHGGSFFFRSEERRVGKEG